MPGKDRKARVFVVEDHVFVRQALVTLINREPDLMCCGEDDTIASTQLNLAKHQPDLLLLDLRLKDGEALELITALKFQHPELKLMVLSQCDEVLYAEKTLRAGANGYLMKQEAAEDVLTALRTVLEGGVYLSRAMDKYLFQSRRWPGSPLLNPGRQLSSPEAEPGRSDKSNPAG